MNDKDYSRLLEFANDGAGLIAVNQNAMELMDQLGKGQSVYFMEETARDIKFHRCYMGLLGYIWDQMPIRFQKQVPKPFFYKFLKQLKGNYDLVFQFKDERKRLIIRELLRIHKKELGLTRLTYKAIDTLAELLGKSDMIEYQSISFGKMSQEAFENFVRDQLPWIYSEVILPLFPDEAKYKKIIEDIEETFKSFMKKLG